MNLAFVRQGSNEERTDIFFINQSFQTVGGGHSAFPVVADSETIPRRNYFYNIDGLICHSTCSLKENNLTQQLCVSTIGKT